MRAIIKLEMSLQYSSIHVSPPTNRVSNDDNLEDVIKSVGVGSIRFPLGLIMILPEAQPRQLSPVVLQSLFL